MANPWQTQDVFAQAKNLDGRSNDVTWAENYFFLQRWPVRLKLLAGVSSVDPVGQPWVMTGFNALTLQVVPTGTVTSFTLLVEYSLDGINWKPVVFTGTNTTGGSITGPLTGSDIFVAPLGGAWPYMMRARLTAAVVGGGTIDVYGVLVRN